MSTSDEALPNMVTVIKTEPETEGEFLEDQLTDVSFEQIFIKQEEGNEDGMEFQATHVEGLEGTQMDETARSSVPIQQNGQDFHLNLHNELPLLGDIKNEPAEETSCAATIDVAEKMRSRFLQILRKQPKAELSTQNRSSNDPGYILPDDNISDEDEDVPAKYVPNMLSRSTTNSSVLKHLQPNDGGLKEYICDICHGSFDKFSIMVRHRETHTPDQPLIHGCKTCGRLFSKLSNLKRHEHAHERQIAVCKDCGRKYRCHSQLMRHQKMNRLDRQVRRYTICQLAKLLRESNRNEHFQ